MVSFLIRSLKHLALAGDRKFTLQVTNVATSLASQIPTSFAAGSTTPQLTKGRKEVDKKEGKWGRSVHCGMLGILLYVENVMSVRGGSRD